VNRPAGDDLAARLDAAALALGVLAERDVPLAPFTTYRLGGPAGLLVRPASVDELVLAGRVAAAQQLPVLVVGRGSNMLVADAGFPGIAVVVAGLPASCEIDASGERPLVEVGASWALPQLARRLVAAGLSGFEWAVGVPGSIGGAVRMNAGGHGSDMTSVLVAARIADLHSGEVAWVPVSRLGLRFRGSDIAAHQVVVAARLALHAGDRSVSEPLLDEIVRWRREHQPGGQNAGSVFVNPVPGAVSAGELIDACGWRGRRHDGAEVSAKHANFIQAGPGATTTAVVELIEQVRRSVATSTGYLLRSEVRVVDEHWPGDDAAGVATSGGSARP
jgi:UDP-N-acetylmuramate dehydrogenase